MTAQRTFFIFILLVLFVAMIPISGVLASEMTAVGNVSGAEMPDATNLPELLVTPTATLSPPSRNVQAPASTPTVLDDFSRVDGTIGPNWSGDTGGYSIVSTQLVVGDSVENEIYWNVTPFAADQEAFVTFASIGPVNSEIGLILKAQSSALNTDLIQVFYKPNSTLSNVQVWTRTSGEWEKQGNNVSVTFQNGDKLIARARAYGQVEVYKNGDWVGTWQLTAWNHNAKPGYIGLFNLAASGTILDDFGGGDLPPAPTPTPSPTPCRDPLTCGVVSAYPAYWQCNIPQCNPTQEANWYGAAISWPSWAAYENNGRNLTNSRTIYSIEDDQTRYGYMGSWAQDCKITAVSGRVLIVEWRRGEDKWDEYYIEPSETHTVDLTTRNTLGDPQNSVLIEGPDGTLTPFQVSLENCSPPTPSPAGTATVGETNILSANQTAVPNVIRAQSITLAQKGIIQSISFYVTHAEGQIRFGIYHDNANNPGTLITETGAFTPVTGWNKQPVLTETLLDPGTYWLAILYADSDLTFTSDGTGTMRSANQPFGPLPTAFPTSPATDNTHYSLNATFIVTSPSAIELTRFETNQGGSSLASIPTPVWLGLLIIFTLGVARQKRKQP